ncbi:MAG TPA: hypothetical protein P5137_11150 [Candidatus Brocadiia bacterium]|nr:hypothetical protein [Candidatus Brocadiia bacterium]
MSWIDVETYFRDLIRQGKDGPKSFVERELDSMRFASMCIALGLDPVVGKTRILNAIRQGATECRVCSN